MAVGIGTGKRPTSDEPLDELLACHQRIRDMIALARRLAGAADAPADEVAAAALRVRRYFVEALPRHVEDEEASLLPRLRGRGDALDAALTAMHDQHGAQGPLEHALIALCDELAADGVHLAGEEGVVFPALAALPDADRRAIRAEMRARRDPPAR
jgi:hypothetical protein